MRQMLTISRGNAYVKIIALKQGLSVALFFAGEKWMM